MPLVLQQCQGCGFAHSRTSVLGYGGNCSWETASLVRVIITHPSIPNYGRESSSMFDILLMQSCTEILKYFYLQVLIANSHRSGLRPLFSPTLSMLGPHWDSSGVALCHGGSAVWGLQDLKCSSRSQMGWVLGMGQLITLVLAWVVPRLVSLPALPHLPCQGEFPAQPH